MFEIAKWRLPVVLFLFVGFMLHCMPLQSQAPAAPLGVFEGQIDVGSVVPPGVAVYNPESKTYTITSAGENLWSTTDAFHFVWKKMSGDVSLTAEIDFPIK